MAATAVDPRVAIPPELRRLGHRLTGPRRAVLEVLAASTEPLAVPEIHGRLGAARANVVSVYRTVNLLVAIGLVRATDSARGRRRYELSEQFTGHHHHLICRGCGRIEDLDGCLLEPKALTRVYQRLRQTRRFRVTDHELRLFGLCRQCEV
jgi:Fe2+ or Zn2+ uptake regulation protein